MIRAFFTDTRGATSVEYAVLCFLITAIFIAAFASIGDSLEGMWGAADDALNANEIPD